MRLNITMAAVSYRVWVPLLLAFFFPASDNKRGNKTTSHLSISLDFSP